VTAKQTEGRPATVPRATQAGEIRARWAWVEPSVWTERMLTALEQGVKGGKWFSLMDKVYSPRNLQAAWRRVRSAGGGAGVDHVTLEEFEAKLESNLERLERELTASAYRPRRIKRSWIPKPGSKEKRPLGVPTVRDRVVQAALLNVLEPIFENKFAPQSYGFRPGRGCKDALRRVNQLLEAGYHWVVDADLKSYFDTIEHQRLLSEVEREVADGRVLELVSEFLKQEVLDGLEAWVPEAGTPQGAVVSPLLSNIYLNPLDHLAAEGGYEMVRYADDFVILCRTREEAEQALSLVSGWAQEVGLRLHPEKTKIVDAGEPGGFDFLGYHFEQGRRTPRKKSLEKFKTTVRDHTKRTNGQSLSAIIVGLNRVLRGWFNYFKHSLKGIFPRLDGWIRMRLRSILRKRRGGKGPGRAIDHQRWPNAYFAKLGLFSLTAARIKAGQSSRR
jgi:RNA-directed DNA polymerase